MKELISENIEIICLLTSILYYNSTEMSSKHLNWLPLAHSHIFKFAFRDQLKLILE